MIQKKIVTSGTLLKTPRSSHEIMDLPHSRGRWHAKPARGRSARRLLTCSRSAGTDVDLEGQNRAPQARSLPANSHAVMVVPLHPAALMTPATVTHVVISPAAVALALTPLTV